MDWDRQPVLGIKRRWISLLLLLRDTDQQTDNWDGLTDQGRQPVPEVTDNFCLLATSIEVAKFLSWKYSMMMNTADAAKRNNHKN